MISRAHAYKLRELIEKASVNLSDDDALDGIELFPAWQTGHEYSTGDRVKYSEKLYKCLMAHTSQGDWTPDVAVSLWVDVANPAIEYPEWRQPTGAHDAYMAGDKVSHNEKHWISDIDYNTYEPSVYGWSEVN